MERASEKKRRLGIFGGTFNPVHNGHLTLAAAAVAALELDQVLFIPAADPPHKTRGQIAAFQDRVAMLVLAIAGKNEFTLSEIEGRRAGPSYTIDTLKAIAAGEGVGADLYFLLGLDAFLDIHTWKEYHHLLDHAHIVVALRSPWTDDTFVRCLSRFFPTFRPDDHREFWHSPDRQGTIRLLHMPAVATSSTVVREATAAGLPLQSMVPPAVAEYIVLRKIYAP